MTRIPTLSLLPVLALIALTAGAAWAQNTAKLTVVPDAGAASADPATYHFTPDEGANGQGITHVFTLKNDTSAPITITRVDASCSCTTAVLQANGAAPAVQNLILAPGTEAKLKATVSFGEEAAGTIDKVVMVHVANQNDPALTLHIEGTIVPLVIYAPASLDFGSAASGKSHVLVFTVGLSPRAPNLGDNPVPVSTVPYVKITPFTHPIPDPMFPKDYRVLAYQATIPADSPMGPFEGTIHFQAAVASQTASTPGGTALVFGVGSAPTTQAVAPTMPTTGLPVMGEITGDLIATPKAAVFGTVAAGKGATVGVVIAGHGGQDMSQTTLTTDQPWLSAIPSPHAGPAGVWDVQITVAPNAPAGAQSANITAQVGGEKIIIPVQAYIVAGG